MTCWKRMWTPSRPISPAGPGERARPQGTVSERVHMELNPYHQMIDELRAREAALRGYL